MFLCGVMPVVEGSVRNLATHIAEPFERRGDAIFHLNPSGGAEAANAAASAAIDQRAIFVFEGRLSSRDPTERRRIDRAVGAALADDPSLGSTLLAGRGRTGRSLLIVFPVAQEVSDERDGTRAVAVLIHLDRPYRVNIATPTILVAAFRLTAREADVALLIAQNRSLIDIARQFDIAEGTARNHVKRAMRKVGAHSQVELANLIARLQ